MKWILVAILVFIIPYTWLMVRYRKPGRGYEPFRDTQEKTRLGQAGYRRITLAAEQSDAIQPAWGGAAIRPATGGWPGDLHEAFLDTPRLPAQIEAVHAAYEMASRERYPIEFSCTLSDPSQRLSRAQLYVKDQELFVAPDFEALSDGLAARSSQTVILLAIPPGSLTPGRYHVTLLGQRLSKTWSLQVN
jgi:hypothetical protein